MCRTPLLAPSGFVHAPAPTSCQALGGAQDIDELAWQPPPYVMVEDGKATTNYKFSL